MNTQHRVQLLQKGIIVTWIKIVTEAIKLVLIKIIKIIIVKISSIIRRTTSLIVY
jgi:hypothetical protein